MKIIYIEVIIYTYADYTDNHVCIHLRVKATLLNFHFYTFFYFIKKYFKYIQNRTKLGIIELKPYTNYTINALNLKLTNHPFYYVENLFGRNL